jgi:carbon-monoxide dehydrogenase large subunit
LEVDAETGNVTLENYFAVDDCGNVINPLLVEGQVHGGIVQSVGQALLEEAVYDEQGQLITGELTDYAIPRASNMPRMETGRTVTPSPVNPMGVKGVGEAGTIGATPALVNAVVDALAPFGVRHADLPLKRERVWELIRKSARAKAPRGAAGGGAKKAKPAAKKAKAAVKRARPAPRKQKAKKVTRPRAGARRRK